jgi:GT2 family glycosyltransferase
MERGPMSALCDVQSSEPAAATRVSAVICTYTEERWPNLVAAVTSLQCQTLPPHQIIVVVDHNARLLQRARDHLPAAIAVPNTGPRGICGARNTGVATAQGDLIAFLDDDATASPHWLQLLVHHCQDAQVLGTGGAVEPVWHSPKPGWFPEEFFWVVGCTYRGLPEETVAVRNLYGGCICLRRDVFTLAGGFRSALGRVGNNLAGCEETDLCIRVRQQHPQGTFLYEPSAKIYHHVPAHRTRWRYFWARCYAEGRSKARLVRLVGARDGLAVERGYAARSVPRAILRALVDGISGEGRGFLRAGAVASGLLITTVGYLTGLVGPCPMPAETAPPEHKHLRPINTSPLSGPGA